jgi:hypothetical protein
VKRARELAEAALALAVFWWELRVARPRPLEQFHRETQLHVDAFRRTLAQHDRARLAEAVEQARAAAERARRATFWAWVSVAIATAVIVVGVLR